jgi:hypothetical protein
MLRQFEQLCEQIKRDYPSSSPKLTSFPSGASMLDVKIGSKAYVMGYFPSIGSYGVSNVDKAIFGWEGFDYPFENFEKAKEFLISLLNKNS